MNSVDRERLAMGRAIDRAASELPDGFDIRIDIENGCGTVYLRNRGDEGPGRLWRMIDGGGEPMSSEINLAIDEALESTQGQPGQEKGSE